MSFCYWPLDFPPHCLCLRSWCFERKYVNRTYIVYGLYVAVISSIRLVWTLWCWGSHFVMLWLNWHLQSHHMTNEFAAQVICYGVRSYHTICTFLLKPVRICGVSICSRENAQYTTTGAWILQYRYWRSLCFSDFVIYACSTIHTCQCVMILDYITLLYYISFGQQVLADTKRRVLNVNLLNVCWKGIKTCVIIMIWWSGNIMTWRMVPTVICLRRPELGYEIQNCMRFIRSRCLCSLDSAVVLNFSETLYVCSKLG